MKKMWAIFMVFLFIIVACGGGGGGDDTPTSSDSSTTSSQVISGVAAAGAPLAGTVSLKDSQGNPSPALTTLLDSEGKFEFDITDLELVPPFFLEAEGVAGNTPYTLHSVITKYGIANVTPLTEAQVCAATGQNPADLFDDPSSAGLSNADMQAALEQAATDLQTMLQPLLDAWQVPQLDFNPITMAFEADGTGMDLFFDGTAVEVTADLITVVDKASGTTFATATVSSTDGLTETDSISDAEAAQVSQTISDFDQIKVFLPTWLTAVKTISAAFAQGDLTEVEALAEFGPYYVDDATFGVNNGKHLDEELNNHLEDYVFINAIQSLSNVGIVSHNSDTGVYLVSFNLSVQLHGPAGVYPVPSVGVVKDGDQWKVTGNGYYADDSVDTIAFKTVRNIYSGGISQITAIDFDLEDEQGVFDQAVVTGPGLPAGGLPFTDDESEWELTMNYDDMAPTLIYNEAEREVEWNSYKLTDDDIAAMPSVCTYTVTYSSSTPGISEEVHTVSLPAKPLLSNEITDGHFPAINSTVPVELTASWAETSLLGQTIDLSYSTPTAIDPLVVGFESWFELNDTLDASSDHLEIWYDGLSHGTDQTKQVTFPSLPADTWEVVSGEIELDAEDTQRRRYQTAYHFQSL